MASLDDVVFELYSINFFYSEVTLASQNIILTQIVNYRDYLRQLGCPPQEINSYHPNMFCAINYVMKNDMQTGTAGAGQPPRRPAARRRRPASTRRPESTRRTAPSRRAEARRRRNRSPPLQEQHGQGYPEPVAQSSQSTLGSAPLGASASNDVLEVRMENGAPPPVSPPVRLPAPEILYLAGEAITPVPPEIILEEESLSGDEVAPEAALNPPEEEDVIMMSPDLEATASTSTGDKPEDSRRSPPMSEQTKEGIKDQLRSELRKRGHKYSRVLPLLENVQGSLAVKKELIEFAIMEAARCNGVAIIQELKRLLAEVRCNQLI
ncbi:integrator complex subunit 6-like isoform X2 [Erinaceus europaeus]|uniref:Integrator complex subunit 6-like isoform X2 n=1 Tax=Erinaceus europaeus TaxID=9365 RepID=A0ABM3WWA8_ERIEU|nr:integrator complex subunit 6-like isoform X2 [Erinaceus europaeus]XP_060040859.1 integrator complex subunit 6-like isoform X2 [Erinaceus europaeus]